MQTRQLPLLIVLTATAACADSAAGPHTRPPNIQFVTGDKQTDTILSTLPLPLLVRINNAPPGKLAAYQVIQFQAAPSINAWEAAVEPPGWDTPQSDVQDTTNGLGEVSVPVILGSTAGPAYLVVTVPAFHYADTAVFTITPGNPWSMRTSPSDTLVYIGTPLTLQSQVYDQALNRRSDSISYHLVSGPATLSGATLTPTALGAVTVSASDGGVSDMVSLTAVPRGAIAMTYGFQIQAYDLDGSGSQLLTPASAPRGGISNTRWAPSGTRIAFDAAFSAGGECGAPTGIYTTDLTGAMATITAPPTGSCDEFPSYSRDGTWIYFSRKNGAVSTLWRVHPDGSAADSLVLATRATEDYDTHPSPSPDGTQVAYSALLNEAVYDLRVVTISTGAVTDLGANGWAAVWSPTSNQIAYIAGSGTTGSIAIINADGTGSRTLATGAYEWGMDWSPDGKYIVARDDGAGYLDVIDATSGATVQLSYTPSGRWPTWDPIVPTGPSSQRLARPRAERAHHK
jgi:Tol biopolymer transport system component